MIRANELQAILFVSILISYAVKLYWAKLANGTKRKT